MAQLLATFLSFQGKEITSQSLNEKLVAFQKPFDEGQRDTFNKILEEKQRHFEIKKPENKAEDVPVEKKQNEKNTVFSEKSKKPVSDKPDTKKQQTLHKNVKHLINKSHSLSESVKELKEKMKKILEKAKPEVADDGKKPNLNVLRDLFAEAKLKSELAGKLTASQKAKDAKAVQAGKLVKANTPKKKTVRTVIIDLRDKTEKKQNTSTINKNVAFKHMVGKKKASSPKTQDTKIYTDSFKGDDAKDMSDIKLFTKHQGMNDTIQEKTADIRDPQMKTSIPLSRLSESLKNEMVKQTGILIKNGDSGEINLVLKPDTLGKVRVKLSLDNNHIVGKIFVDNHTVKQIVEGNMDHLKNSFSDKGYQNSMIEVFVQGEGSSQAEEADRQLMEAWYPGSNAKDTEEESIVYEPANDNSSYVNIVL